MNVSIFLARVCMHVCTYSYYLLLYTQDWCSLFYNEYILQCFLSFLSLLFLFFTLFITYFFLWKDDLKVYAVTPYMKTAVFRSYTITEVFVSSVISSSAYNLNCTDSDFCTQEPITPCASLCYWWICSSLLLLSYITFYYTFFHYFYLDLSLSLLYIRLFFSSSLYFMISFLSPLLPSILLLF